MKIWTSTLHHFPSALRIYFNISSSADLLVMNAFCIFIPEKYLFYLHYWKIFPLCIESRVTGSFFSIWRMLLHCLLACFVFYGNSSIILIFAPLCVMCPFSPLQIANKIFSLSLAFRNWILMFLDVVFFIYFFIYTNIYICIHICAWDLLWFLDLIIYSFYQILKNSAINLQIFFSVALSSHSPSGPQLHIH